MSSCGQTAPSTACSGPRVLLYDLDEGAAVGAESPRLIKHLTSQGIQDDVDATTVGQAQNALGEDGVSRPKDLPGIDAVVLDQELAFSFFFFFFFFLLFFFFFSSVPTVTKTPSYRAS
jgi:hypothetical protein